MNFTPAKILCWWCRRW